MFADFHSEPSTGDLDLAGLHRVWVHQVMPALEDGQTVDEISEWLSVDVDYLLRLARRYDWPRPVRPRGVAVTIVHVASPAGDEHRDQVCQYCRRVLRLRRYAHVAREFFAKGSQIYELGGRLTPGRPGGPERPCRLGVRP